MDVLRTEFPKTDRAFPLGDPASRAGPRPRSLPPDSEAALPATQAPDRTSEPVRRRALTFPKTAPNTARAVTPGLGGRPSHARRQDYSLPVRKNPPRLERPPEVPRCLQTCHAPFVPRGMSISWPTVGVRRRRPTFSPDPPVRPPPRAKASAAFARSGRPPSNLSWQDLKKTQHAVKALARDVRREERARRNPAPCPRTTAIIAPCAHEVSRASTRAFEPRPRLNHSRPAPNRDDGTRPDWASVRGRPRVVADVARKRPFPV